MVVSNELQEIVHNAFGANTDLKNRIFAAIEDNPRWTPLFHDIAQYHLNHHSEPLSAFNEDEHPNKKRKLPNGSVQATTDRANSEQVILEARDLSFSLPQRKKYHLFVHEYTWGSHNDIKTFDLSLIDPKSNQAELEVPLNQYAHVLRLPVPEKAQKQYNFCIFPKLSAPANVEPIIWTVNEGAKPKQQIVNNELNASKDGYYSADAFERWFKDILEQTDLTFTTPTEAEFASANPESHRKHETAYHVKAFRGSKDGYLFFLSNGIFFGFKKPLQFFSFDSISSISYTSVLARTFNLNISYKPSADAAELEIEFSMLDQADFNGIDIYIKRHELQDASLAEARRAKKVKAAKGKDEEDGEPGELEKAQQQIQDEEDEEDELEEDYDPGSDGESEGSGDSDEEGDFPANSKGKDLVQDELGSEAEDVEITSEGGAEEEEQEEDEEDIDEELEKQGLMDDPREVRMGGNREGEPTPSLIRIDEAERLGLLDDPRMLRMQGIRVPQRALKREDNPPLDDDDQL